MGSSLVIVAIPATDDPIWKISSEKVPHLTLLFLGDAKNNSKITEIYRFVQHAVHLSEHGPFYLDVDRRDVLGEDKADVLHFRKDWSFKWVKQFRNQLLQHPDIRTAYDSTEQYPEWQPHLTLGYPETPAHEDKIPNHGLDMIRFDRIAVWTGNYEGPEFRLEYAEREEELEVAYSETGSVAVKEVLEHFGTKGMRWGVRKAANVVTDLQFKKVANKSDTISKLVSTASKKTRQNDLPRINAKHKDLATTSKSVHLVGPSRVPAQKAYREEVRKAYEKNLNDAAKETTSYSENLRYEIRPPRLSKKQTAIRWRVKVVKVQHANVESDEYDIILVEDEAGYIIDFKAEPVTEDLIQTAVNGSEFVDTLIHVGVRGMRWGVRKAPPTPVAPQAVSVVPQSPKRKTKIEVEGGQNHGASDDAIKVAVAKVKLQKSGPAALSNKELQEVAQRVELEDRVKRAVQPKGRKFVSEVLRNQGKQEANQFVNRQVKKKFMPV